jgi:DNA processing protein
VWNREIDSFYNKEKGRAAVLRSSQRLRPPFSRGSAEAAALTRLSVDLLLPVAVSMLSVSRSRAASIFKEIRQNLSRVPGTVLPRRSVEIREDDAVLEAVLAGCGVPVAAFDRLIAEARDRTRLALRAAKAAGIAPITILDSQYPALLGAIPDPPPVLWVQGDSRVLSRPTVAVVGSRAATAYALEVAARLGEELARRGMAVASGLARGVDSAAHRGCLQGGGQTVAVLGSGLDRIYPPEHRDLAVTISGNGILASELAPGAAPLQEHFPLRNRIISGISLAVVVVEASEKSGSLITARSALEQGRDVLAVPGSVLSGRNRGSHSLLKDGAKVVETADDILEELGWCSGPPRPDGPSKSMTADPLLARMEPGEVYRLEDLMAMTGTSGPKLLARLTELELNGLVTGQGGVGFARVARSG